MPVSFFTFTSILTLIEPFCILFTFSTAVHTYRYAHTHINSIHSRYIYKYMFTCSNHNLSKPHPLINDGFSHTPDLVFIHLAMFVNDVITHCNTLQCYETNLSKFQIQPFSVVYLYTIYIKEVIFLFVLFHI